MTIGAAGALRRLRELYALIQSDILADRATDGRLEWARRSADALATLWPSDKAVQRVALEVSLYSSSALDARKESRRAHRLAKALERGLGPDYMPSGITTQSSCEIAKEIDEGLAAARARAKRRKLWRRTMRRIGRSRP